MHLSKICWYLAFLAEIDTEKKGAVYYLGLDSICDSLPCIWSLASPSAWCFTVLSIMGVRAQPFLTAKSLHCLICLEHVDNHGVNNYIKFVSFRYSGEWKNTFRCSDRINLFKRQQVNHLKKRMIFKKPRCVFCEKTTRDFEGSYCTWFKCLLSNICK